MTNTNTTAEMAVRLKAAGWPQPMPKISQYWAFERERDQQLYTGIITPRNEFFSHSDTHTFVMSNLPSVVFEVFAYCPSVIELMQALAELNADPQLEMDNGLFFARIETTDDLLYQSGHNPADLFGELWLKIKTT